MPDLTCAKCGHPLAGDGQFCANCGAVNARPPVHGSASRTLFDPGVAPAGEKASQATMFGFSAASLPKGAIPPASAPAPIAPSAVAPPVAPAAPPPASSPPAASPHASHKSTMLGIASPLAAAATPAAASPASAPLPTSLPSAKGTMLGVALPGIAPLRASAAAEPEAPRRGPGSTMLGVALPGIAPVAAPPRAEPPRAAARPAPAVLPMPAPLVDDEPAIGPAPRVDRRGVPLAYVAGAVFALVLVCGVAVALLWKGQSLIVVPRLDAQGRDQLHLVCDSCQDGTTAAFGGATATFASKEADLTLATPLAVGDNAITIRLDRPRWGRDEDVKVTVPVAFRIKADLAGLTGAHPTVVVRVEAVPGATVTVDGKPLALDARGTGAYPIDVTAQTSGFSDDLHLIDQSIPYSITSGVAGKGVEQHGNLAVRAGIATLHLDAPGPSAVLDTASFRIAGRTLKGGAVTANGQPVPVEPDGSFAKSYDAPSEGVVEVDLRAEGPQLASRSARFAVKRVARLADEAKARERAPWIGYGAIVADPTGSVGKDAVVEGDVVEARAASSQVIALIGDARGCNQPDASACLVRVVYTGDEPMKHGQHVRVYGKVTGSVAAPAGSASAVVPVVRADFAVRGRAKGER